MSIPATVQASAAVARNTRYEGQLPIKLMPRLAQAIAQGSEPVEVELQAGRDAGYPGVQGHIHGSLRLVCQRCEGTFQWSLETEFKLRLVTSELEERETLHDCDPYLVQDDTLPLRELVEEEILLALPMLARCESCENSVKAAPAPARQEAPVRENPFAALKKQLKH